MYLLKLIFTGFLLFSSLYSQKAANNEVSVKKCEKYLRIAQSKTDTKAFNDFLICFGGLDNREKSIINNKATTLALSYFQKVFKQKPKKNIIEQYHQASIDFAANAELSESLAEEFSNFVYKYPKVVILLISNMHGDVQKRLLSDAIFVERKDKRIEKEIAKYPALIKILSGR